MNKHEHKINNLKDARACYRSLYLTEPAVTEIIDYLVSQTEFPERAIKIYGKDTANIAHDFWLYGWVVIDTEKPIIYSPDDIKVVSPSEIFYKKDSVEMDISSHAVLLANRYNSEDKLGHSAIEALILDPKIAIEAAYGFDKWQRLHN